MISRIGVGIMAKNGHFQGRNMQNLRLPELWNAETLPGIYDPGDDSGYYDAWNDDVMMTIVMVINGNYDMMSIC